MKRFFYLTTLLLVYFFASAQNVGIGTDTPLARLHVADSAVLFTGPSSLPQEPGLPPMSGSGTRMMWYPNKAAFRAGKAEGTSWDDSNIGKASFAAGNSPIASGYGAVAFHFQSLASGDQSFAAGDHAEATAAFTIAMGFRAKSTEYSSVAIGEYAKAGGAHSVAFQRAEANANSSQALGMGTVTNAYGQTSVGIYNLPTLFADAGDWRADDPVFSVGNGSGIYSRNTALTVLKNGNTGIGTTSPGARLQVEGNLLLRRNSSIGNAHLTLEETGNTDGARITFKSTPIAGKYWDVYGYSHPTNNAEGRFALYYYGVGNTFVSYGNGNAWIRGSLTQNSDMRLKKDITPINGALKKITQLSGYTYYWKDSLLDNRLQAGLIAQEVEVVLPELVSTSGDGTKSVNYSALIPYLLQAIKEQEVQIKILKEQLDNHLQKQESPNN